MEEDTSRDIPFDSKPGDYRTRVFDIGSQVLVSALNHLTQET